MSTISRVDVGCLNEISPIRASAITLSCAPKVKHNPTMNSLYDMAAQQESTIVTDTEMADPKSLGLSRGRDRVMVSFTGQDVARSAWARLIAPQPAEIERNPALLDTKDRIERLTREVNFHLMHRDLIHTELYFGRNPEFMGKIHCIVPAKYAKLAFDLNINFIQNNPETKKLYDASETLPLPDLWLVCEPDWVNPVWQAWRNRVGPADLKRVNKDPEPKRIMMLFDIPHYTAYLLGARYFGEMKKACLTMIWDAAINAGIGMPIHGSSKTIFYKPRIIGAAEEPKEEVKESKAKKASAKKAKSNGKATSKAKSKSNGKANGKANGEAKGEANGEAKGEAALKEMTFLTIGLSGSGKSTLGCDPHYEHLNAEEGERIHLGNDDALVILSDPKSRGRGTVGLENGAYNKSNDYTPESFYIKTVQSAENVMVARDAQGRLFAVHQDTLNGNGRVQTARHMLPGADEELDTPWPDYVSLLMKDETLPPVMLLEEPTLLVSMYMCLATRSTTAENIPVHEMGKLKMVPGANPFSTWGMQREAECLEDMVERTGARGIVLNTGGFFIDAAHQKRQSTRKVPKEFSLSVYPMLAHGKIKWVSWDRFPGVKIPAPNTFEEIYPGFEEAFNPMNVKEPDNYYELLRERLLQRQNFLLKLRIDRRFVLPIRKAIIEIDERELKTFGRSSHVDNLDTFLDPGRDKASY